MAVTLAGDEIVGAGPLRLRARVVAARRARALRARADREDGRRPPVRARRARGAGGGRAELDARPLRQRAHSRSSSRSVLGGSAARHRRHVALARDAVEDDRADRLAGAAGRRGLAARGELRGARRSRWRRAWASGRRARRRNVPPAGRLPPWAAGVAAALFVAGAGALAGSLVAPETPLWPSSAFESAAWPWVAAALAGLPTVSAIGVGLFVLHILDRVTAAWTRRSWLAGAVVVALIAGLVAREGAAMPAPRWRRASRRGSSPRRSSTTCCASMPRTRARLPRDGRADRRRGERRRDRHARRMDGVRAARRR